MALEDINDLEQLWLHPLESEDYDELSTQYLLCSNSTDNYTYTSVFCNRTFFILRDDEDVFELQRIVAFVVPIIFGIIFIVGLFGNVLVVLVIASNQQMRNTTNFLILNLAIADLLFIIFCIPFTATDYVLSYWPFGLIWCKMVQYLIIVTAYSSVFTLVLMSLDRFLAVVYPVTSISLRTEKNILLAIGITWIIILGACSPALVAHGLESPLYNLDIEVCKFKEEYNQFVFQIIFMLTSYAIPLLIICFLYFGMIFRLWKSVSSSTAISNQSIRGKKRVTRMIVVVVAVFALCWLPIQVVLVLKSLNRYYMSNLAIACQITSHVLGYMNSCVNPILYAFLSDNFRKGFRKVIQCKISCNSRVRGGGLNNAGSSKRRRRSRAPSNVTNIDDENFGNHLNHYGRTNSLVVNETTLLTTHCENGGKNSHRILQTNSGGNGNGNGAGNGSNYDIADDIL